MITRLDAKWHPLVKAVCDQHKLDLNNTSHGLDHWCRVIQNGLRLAEVTPNVDKDIVIAFGLLHDSARTHDEHCEEHGPDSFKVINALKEHIPLSNEQTLMLMIACGNHTGAAVGDFPLFDETIHTCFDADRLDLFRCQIVPDNQYLFTEAAKNADLQEWANSQSEFRTIPCWAIPLYDLVGL